MSKLRYVIEPTLPQGAAHLYVEDPNVSNPFALEPVARFNTLALATEYVRKGLRERGASPELHTEGGPSEAFWKIRSDWVEIEDAYPEFDNHSQ